MNLYPRNDKPRVRGEAGTEHKGNPEYLDACRALCGAPLRLAMLAVDEVHGHLHNYAASTDTPASGAVEAADLLDTVADLLGKAVRP